MKTTFRHNAIAKVYRVRENDFMGQPVYSVNPKRARVAVLYMHVGIQESSIRADRSESKARAEEPAGKVRILVHSDDSIELTDKVELHGHTLRVINMFPRHDLDGRLHHFQVDLEPWPANSK